MDEKYAKAYVEVLEIISYFSEEEYEKIPKEKIEFYENNKDKNYEFSFNPDKDLKEQNVSNEAKAIIVNLFDMYFATDEQKELLKQILLRNAQRREEENKNKYSDSLNKEDEIKNTELIVRDESVFIKIWNYIKGIFKKK